jgi:hypothetical protein
MIVIHYPTAFKALDRFIDQYNANAVTKKDKLRSGTVMTAKELIRIYGISLLKANGSQQILKDNLPTLQTNNMQLAKLVKCSSRTIQRHIIKLRQSGIITEKIFHGSNSNYEVLINPNILLIKQKLSVDNANQELQQALIQAKQNEAKSSLSTFQKTNCPHTYSSNTRNINNIIIGVCNSFKITSQDRGNNFQKNSLPLTNEIHSGNVRGYTGGNTGEIAKENFKSQEKKLQEAGEIASRASDPAQKIIPPDAARDNFLNLYVSLLWLTTRNLLYKTVDLTDRQVLIAKNLIRKLYEPVATERLSNTHQHYVERIVLVSKYLKKDPLRFVPLPYRYFDTNNPTGFIGTKKWHKADQLRKREVERELTLSKLIRRYQNNEKKPQTNKKQPLQLFRECENTIGKFNDPVLTERFHAAVLNYESYRQITYTN